MPYGVTRLAGPVFKYRKGLTKVTIPDSVTAIGEMAFGLCENLTNVEIPDSVENISDCAFYCCYELEEISIPDNVTDIVYSAFAGCHSITKIFLPAKIKSVGEVAFSTCSNIECVSIPNSVVMIEGGAFNKCDSITDVYYFGNKEQWGNIDIRSGNDCLTNADIHFITASEIEPLAVTNNQVTALIAPVCGAAEQPTAWCVGYDSAGRMLWVKQKSLTANQMNELTFELEDGAVSVKILALTGDFVPLCKSAVWGQR